MWHMQLRCPLDLNCPVPLHVVKGVSYRPTSLSPVRGTFSIGQHTLGFYARFTKLIPRPGNDRTGNQSSTSLLKSV